jgi:transposase-like protein
MAESQSMTTSEVVAKTLITEHADFLRDAVAMVARELMEAEISGEIGAGRGEVSPERQTHRNGYRPRPWETRVGEIEPAIPRKREGEAYFPSFLRIASAEPPTASQRRSYGRSQPSSRDGSNRRMQDPKTCLP